MASPQLSAKQLAAATPVDAAKPAKELPCFDQSGTTTRTSPALGPELVPARVFTHDGLLLAGKGTTSPLPLAMPIVKQLGVVSEARMEELFEEAQRQAKWSGWCIQQVGKLAIGASCFLTEVLDLLHDFLFEALDKKFVVLPNSAIAGKGPVGGGSAGVGGGSAGSIGATPVPVPAPVTPVPRKRHIYETPRRSNSSRPTHNTKRTYGRPNRASPLLFPTPRCPPPAADHRCVPSGGAGDAHPPHGLLVGRHIRQCLEGLHGVLVAVGGHGDKVKIVVDAVARGDRLVLARVTGPQVLGMFTGLLPKAYGVENELFTADIARCRKSVGLVAYAGGGAARPVHARRGGAPRPPASPPEHGYPGHRNGGAGRGRGVRAR